MLIASKAGERLEAAIKRFEGYESYKGSPECGPIVVAAYKAGKIGSLEDALYIMAFLLEESNP